MLLFISFKFNFRMSEPESVQYFQFDQEGNMYMYPAGAGITGIPKLVRPGDELTFSGVDCRGITWIHRLPSRPSHSYGRQPH